MDTDPENVHAGIWEREIASARNIASFHTVCHVSRQDATINRSGNHREWWAQNKARPSGRPLAPAAGRQNWQANLAGKTGRQKPAGKPLAKGCQSKKSTDAIQATENAFLSRHDLCIDFCEGLAAVPQTLALSPGQLPRPGMRPRTRFAGGGRPFRFVTRFGEPGRWTTGCQTRHLSEPPPERFERHPRSQRGGTS